MNPPDILATALADNCATLTEGAGLIGALAPEFYARKHDFCYQSSIGGHYRHVIDHYFSFLKGCAVGVVNYESRERDPLLETDPSYAAQTTGTLLSALGALQPATFRRQLLLRSEFESSAPESEQAWAVSSHLRELDFLLSHTLHHFALIGTICGVLRQPVPAHFGIAPSTLRHRAALARAQVADAPVAAAS